MFWNKGSLTPLTQGFEEEDLKMGSHKNNNNSQDGIGKNIKRESWYTLMCIHSL